MADPPSRPAKPTAADPDRMPTRTELLYELRKHGAKPPPRQPQPVVGRRTRDFLLVAGVGSLAITLVCFRILSGSEPATVLRLAFTGVALFCGMAWFVFYGVMSRY